MEDGAWQLFGSVPCANRIKSPHQPNFCRSGFCLTGIRLKSVRMMRCPSEQGFLLTHRNQASPMKAPRSSTVSRNVAWLEAPKAEPGPGGRHSALPCWLDHIGVHQGADSPAHEPNVIGPNSVSSQILYAWPLSSRYFKSRSSIAAFSSAFESARSSEL